MPQQTIRWIIKWDGMGCNGARASKFYVDC